MIDLDTQSIRARILQKLGEQCQYLLAMLPSGDEKEPQILWGRRSIRPEELPAVVITPQPESATKSYGADEITMPVTVAMVCLLGEHNPLDLGEYLLAQMREYVAADSTMGDLAGDTRYMEGGIDEYPESNDQALVVSTTWEIDYTTLRNNPNEGA
jgi:hypothetical protein